MFMFVAELLKVHTIPIINDFDLQCDRMLWSDCGWHGYVVYSTEPTADFVIRDLALTPAEVANLLQKKFQSLTVITQIAWKFVGFIARSVSSILISQSSSSTANLYPFCPQNYQFLPGKSLSSSTSTNVVGAASSSKFFGNDLRAGRRRARETGREGNAGEKSFGLLSSSFRRSEFGGGKFRSSHVSVSYEEDFLFESDTIFNPLCFAAQLFVNGEIVQRSPERHRRVEPVPQSTQDELRL
ncbi:hypothetical protein RHMOL_Rhmol13G0047600 [Rhododendron molle]|uniref:Uncharacterized protein n=1 Tax=Rhododendron molle TaxID=49168 RepID=A0ACC0L3U4_RHOML|nr:hypothetical protein RHMOL_Rhmol13G0047600 [Rhododendron molle]